MKGNEEEQELLNASRPKFLLMIKISPGYSAAWDLNTTQSQEKLQKSMNWKLLHKGQFKKK